MKVNATDTVYTLDIDGNHIHAFAGWSWNELIETPRNVEYLKIDGSIRAKVYNRRGDLTQTLTGF